MANLLPVSIDLDTGKLVASPNPTVGPPGTVTGAVYHQVAPSLTWTFTHNKNTMNVMYQVFDVSYSQIIPDAFIVLNLNTVQVNYTSAIAGYLHVTFF